MAVERPHSQHTLGKKIGDTFELRMQGWSALNRTGIYACG